REESGRRLRTDELALPERRQLAYRNTVTGDDERLAAIERPHDLAALVTKLSLGDLSRHAHTVARVLQDAQRLRGDQRTVCTTPSSVHLITEPNQAETPVNRMVWRSALCCPASNRQTPPVTLTPGS